MYKKWIFCESELFWFVWRFYYTIARNLHVLPGIIATMRRMADAPEANPEQDCYAYAQTVVARMLRTGWVRTECYGAELLPQTGGYLMYPNHQGKYDAYGIVACHQAPCTVVMDKEKSALPFVNEIIDLLRGKRLDVRDNRQAATVIRQVSAEVAAGRRYILFPQGGYAPDQGNTTGEFKPGCFKAALKSRCPIVPVVLFDSYKVYNSWQLTPVTTQVHFLQPIPYEEYQGMKTPQIAALVRQRIQAKLDELTAEQARRQAAEGLCPALAAFFTV